MNKNNDGKLWLIASIAFGLAAVAWFIQAMSTSELVYEILAVVNAVLAVVDGMLYMKYRR